MHIDIFNFICIICLHIQMFQFFLLLVKFFFNFVSSIV